VSGLTVIPLHVLLSGDGVSVHTVDNLLALPISLFPLSKLQQVFRLDLEQAAFDGGGATQPPQQARQSEHEFSLDRRLRVIVGGHDQFEGRIVIGIFQRVDHGFCGQAMTKRILPRLSFALFGEGTRAQTRGWPRFEITSSSGLRATNWLRFVILTPISDGAGSAAKMTSIERCADRG